MAVLILGVLNTTIAQTKLCILGTIHQATPKVNHKTVFDAISQFKKLF